MALAGYSFRKKLTIDATKIDLALTDFPVLVKLDNGNFDFSKALPNGHDIRFTDSDGNTLLKFERERHISGNAEYWVKIPNVNPATDTDFFIYYGNGSATDDEDAINVWDSDFNAVYHLSDFNDSTSNGHNLINQGTDVVEAKVAEGKDFIRTESDRINVPISASNLPTYSIEFLFKKPALWDSGASTEEFFFDRREDDSNRTSISLQADGTLLHFNTSNGVSLTTTITSWAADTWFHIFITNDGGIARLYVDGVLDVTDNTGIGGLDDVIANLSHLGAQFFSGSYQSHLDGTMDEFRISSTDRASEWVKASYNSSVDTLLTYGAEELFVYDIDTDIRTVHTLALEDVDIDIRTGKEVWDVPTDVRSKVFIPGLAFDGIDDTCIHVGQPITGYPFSIFVRGRIDSIGVGFQDMFSQARTTSGRNYLRLGGDPTIGIHYEVRNDQVTGGPPTSGWISIDGGPTDNEYHDIIAVSAASNDHKLYVDGILVGTSILNTAFPSGTMNRTCAAFWQRQTSNAFGEVSISEIATWDVALDQPSIDILSQLPGNGELGISKIVLPDNITLHWLFNGFDVGVSADGATITDESENGKDGFVDDGGNNTGTVGVFSPVFSIAPTIKDAFSDIRITHPVGFFFADTDIRTKHTLSLSDITTDIRATGFSLNAVNTDIRVGTISLSDIDNDIRVIQRVNETQIIINSTTFFEGVFVCDANVTILMDVENAINMAFRRENESVFSPFEIFVNTKDFTLSAGDGNKSVFIKFQDIEGNVSQEIQLDIVLDTSTPNGVNIEAFEDETATVPIIDSVFQNDKGPFFRWLLPTFPIPYTGFSTALDAVPNDIINVDIPDMVRDGLDVTKATPFPEMTLDISSGFFYVTTTLAEFDAETQLLSDGGAQDRIDLVYLDGLEQIVKVVEGVEAASPIAPELPNLNNPIALAEVLVPAGTTLIANVTITDIRVTHINIPTFLDSSLTAGVHTFQVRAITQCNTISDVSVFNLAISNICPEMGEILGFTDGTKTIQLSSNIYQTATDTIFLEWGAAPAEPGPITYHYTTDGSEPTLASPSTTGTTLNLGPFAEGITTINIKPFDDTSGNTCRTKNFIFIFGSASPTGDTLVISGGTTLKQSLKEVQVNTISWNFDSARICKIFQPAEFDDNLPFSLNEDITVVHNDITVFSGKIKKIDRAMTINGEGVTYICTGPRGILTECFAVVDTPDGLNSSIITFEDEPVESAVTSIINTVPDVIKNIQSLPSGSDINVTLQSQSVDQAIQNLFIRTKFGWYIKPDGTFVSVASDVINPNNAKFGIYGTVVDSISPQFNVMSSNLQFDVSKRYNRAIVEGAKKQVLREVPVACLAAESFNGFYLEQGNWAEGDFTKYTLVTDFKVTKVLDTRVTYKRLLSSEFYGTPFGEDIQSGTHYNFLDFETCDNNVITKVKRTLLTGGFAGFSQTITTTDTFPQGTLAGDNVVSFSREAANIWFKRNYRTNNYQVDTQVGDTLVKYCANIKASALIEIEPLRVDVSVSGSADGLGSKTLRMVDTSFKFSEDPENPIDDTARMTAFAIDKLESLKDIKVNGTITLDTIDTSWTLDNSVNLINTNPSQGWNSLNAKVVAIQYNFDENTTTLELTSEFLK